MLNASPFIFKENDDQPIARDLVKKGMLVNGERKGPSAYQ